MNIFEEMEREIELNGEYSKFFSDILQRINLGANEYSWLDYIDDIYKAAQVLAEIKVDRQYFTKN